MVTAILYFREAHFYMATSISTLYRNTYSLTYYYPTLNKYTFPCHLISCTLQKHTFTFPKPSCSLQKCIFICPLHTLHYSDIYTHFQCHTALHRNTPSYAHCQLTLHRNSHVPTVILNLQIYLFSFPLFSTETHIQMPAVIRALNINTYSDAHCYQCTHTVIHIHRPTAYLTLQIHTIQFHCFPELYRHTFPFHCCSPHYRNTHSHVHCHFAFYRNTHSHTHCILHYIETHIHMLLLSMPLK